MKQQTILVTLSFSDDITEQKDIQEIVQNVANALEDGAKGRGLSPQDGDTFTTGIQVVDWFNKAKQVEIKL